MLLVTTIAVFDVRKYYLYQAICCRNVHVMNNKRTKKQINTSFSKYISLLNKSGLTKYSKLQHKILAEVTKNNT